MEDVQNKRAALIEIVRLARANRARQIAIPSTKLQAQVDDQRHNKQDEDLCARRAERRCEYAAARTVLTAAAIPPAFFVSSIHVASMKFIGLSSIELG